VNNSELDIDILLAYLEGSLDAKRMHDVEKRALEDPFIAQALEGLSHSAAPLQSLSLLQKQVHERVAQKPLAEKRWRLTTHRLSIAATAAVLFVSASLLFWMRDTNRRTREAANAAAQSSSVASAPGGGGTSGRADGRAPAGAAAGAAGAGAAAVKAMSSAAPVAGRAAGEVAPVAGGAAGNAARVTGERRAAGFGGADEGRTAATTARVNTPKAGSTVASSAAPTTATAADGAAAAAVTARANATPAGPAGTGDAIPSGIKAGGNAAPVASTATRNAGIAAMKRSDDSSVLLQARPAGGRSQWENYIRQNKDQSVLGGTAGKRVLFRFALDNEGKANAIEAQGMAGAVLSDAEKNALIRLLQNGPKWIPESTGTAKNQRYSIEIEL